MKHIIALQFYFLSVFSYSQNFQINKIVVDKNTKEPIEYAEVFNSESNSVTNNYGSFIFSSTKNEINIKKLGYEDMQIKFDDFKGKDTIYMNPKMVLLDEVIISDYKPIINKVYKKIPENYQLKPFSDQFFLRSILKKDGAIVKFQDISGKAQRETMFMTPQIKKNKYKVEILNMRKTGIIAKSQGVDFRLHNFKVLLNWYTTIFTTPNFFNYTIEKNIDSDNYKIHFEKNNLNTDKIAPIGYYIINKNNLAISEFSSKYAYENLDEIPFSKTGNFKFRTTDSELFVNFKINDETKKYSINNASLKQRIEVIKKDNSITYIYEITYELVTTKSFIKEEVNSNFSENSDIFKAKFPYSEEFWKYQNQLPLTPDLKDFLNEVKNIDSKKSEFEIIQNFN